jgi:aldehyde:ferredoxin oxidoreductase
MIPGISKKKMANLLTAITGIDWDADKVMKTGERVFTLEKMFNIREGFTRKDDSLPERFFTEPFTSGPEKGAKLDRQEFIELMDTFYADRNWDIQTTRPSDEKLESLGLGFTI